jgi:hypothetical protein
MSHKRQDIRDATYALLNTHTSVGTNVFKNRVINLQQTQLPAIDITTTSETATPRGMNATVYIRKLELKIRIMLDALSDIDDEIDDIAAEVEAILFANKSLSGTCSGSTYQSMNIEIDDQGSKIIAVGEMIFEVNYIL